MVDRSKVVNFLDESLDVEHFNQVEDADFNGAWTEGSKEVKKIGLCTNTTFENIESAKKQGCDLVIVHHGGWKRFDKDLLEEKKDKIENAGITWYIAHQPLDCADEFGVCGALAEKLGIKVESKYCNLQGGHHGRIGQLEISEKEFFDRIEEIEPNYETVGEIQNVENAKIGIVGGGGGCFSDIVQETIEKDCDLFITGNSHFYTEIYAFEKDLDMITLEETSSERWGVYALGNELIQEFPNLEKIKIKEKNW